MKTLIEVVTYMPALTLALFGVLVAAVIAELWFQHCRGVMDRRRASAEIAERNRVKSNDEMTGDFCAIADRIAAEEDFLNSQK